MQSTAKPQPTQRDALFRRLERSETFDVAVVGGGATGLGIALDAASRGLKVVLVESHDFAKGTSSRSTKLIHGGVRYLAQGNIALVREALHERKTILQMAPHLAQPLSFVVPSYQWWEIPFYGAGLTLYDLLAGSAGLGRTRFLGRTAALAALPAVQAQGLRGAVQYWDAQFNDARFAITLARTAAREGALLINYCKAIDLEFAQGKVSGLRCEDTETGAQYSVQSRCVINATGVWVDALRQRDGEINAADGRHPTKPMIAPSQGVHLVVDSRFLGGKSALMVPATSDGRVLFAVPWLGKVILGTTDTPRHDLPREPLAYKEEVDFILGEAAKYLALAPQRSDVLSVWVGLRPLVKPRDEAGESTKGLSREHTVLISRSNLVTVTGGKWTTYRAMAQDVLKKCLDRGLIVAADKPVTQPVPLVGWTGASQPNTSIVEAQGLHSYGSESSEVAALQGADRQLAPGLTEGMVRFAARFEYARTVEDVLARRNRLLFLDAAAAIRVAPEVSAILEAELGEKAGLEDFLEMARHYLELPA